MLAREEALSPIPLPDSKLFKNQVSCTKSPHACVRACTGHGAAQSGSVFVHASRAGSFTASVFFSA